MMRKIGFTLAEVLITLAIIGVVAALVTPSLVSAYQKTKVGPSLRKFVSTMEIANEHLLGENSASTITYITSDTKSYLDALTNYLKGTVAKVNGVNTSLGDLALAPTLYTGGTSETLTDKNTYIYNFNNKDAFAVKFREAGAILVSKSIAQGSYKGIVAEVFYDMNGFDTKPNRLGKDIFHYYIDNGGALIPDGGKQYNNAYSSDAYSKNKDPKWESSCSEKTISDGWSCAGSVADNNGKVIYKY